MDNNNNQEVENNATETKGLLEDDAEPQLQQLRGHKRECALAILLCFGAALGDLLRWILLLVFRDRVHAFYYSNNHLHGIVTGSIVWDFVCFMICTALYYLHKQWIQLPDYGRWSRFFVLYAAIVTRLFMMTAMVFGDASSSRSLQGFVFVWQIVYYFFVILAWIRPLLAYVTGLLYEELVPVITNNQQEMVEEKTRPVSIPVPTTIATSAIVIPPVVPVSLYDSEVDIRSVQPPYLTPPTNESQYL